MKITDYDPMSLDFGVRYDDVFAGRHPEDGAELLAQVYYITAVAPDGMLFKRYVATWGWVTDCDAEDGFPLVYQAAFQNGRPLHIDRERLEEVASGHAARLQASTTRRLNPDGWECAGAIYGSEAYQQGGWEERTAAEEREAERWG